MVEVAVAVFEKNDLFLMQQRPLGKSYAGYWEFPGGKIEEGESNYDALVRECHEELNVHVKQAILIFDQVHTYPENTYKLHIFKIIDWDGTFQNKEQQHHAWYSHKHIPDKLLAANKAIIERLLTHTAR